MIEDWLKHKCDSILVKNITGDWAICGCTENFEEDGEGFGLE